MTLLRRNFLHLFAGVAAIPLSGFAQAQVSPTTSQSVRVATGLLAMWQSTAWLGAEAGVFKKRGIDMTMPAIAVGGPEAAAGLIRGDWEFAHTGTVPVAEEVLKGRDVVILATPTSDFPKSFVMTRKEITQLAQLDGKKVGVLTETGQTSVATRITVEKAGATATYLPLIKFDRIYAALAAGEIDAGALPIDLRFSGQARYGWTMRRMAAVDTSGLQADLRAFQQQQRAASSPAEPQRQRGSGWVEPRPLEPPPGVALADRLVDAQDKIDRAELIQRELKLARMGKGDAG